MDDYLRYLWLDGSHAVFFSEASAEIGFDETERELGKMLALIPLEDEADDERMRIAQDAIAELVEHYQ